MAVRQKAMCPVCGDSINLEGYMEIGSTLVCSGCDTMVRLIELDPPELEVDSGRDCAEDADDENDEAPDPQDRDIDPGENN
jgi:lysine biosynthesis protein LysW